MTCTFFGHRDAPVKIQTSLKSAIVDLIINNSVDMFYIGNNGNFDMMVLNILSELSEQYKIKYYVVTAYLNNADKQTNAETIYPDGIELVPLRFAISYRNKWMVEHSDYVVTYVTRPYGGAAKFLEYSEQKKKEIIKLAAINEQ